MGKPSTLIFSKPNRNNFNFIDLYYKKPFLKQYQSTGYNNPIHMNKKASDVGGTWVWIFVRLIFLRISFITIIVSS